MGDNPRNDERPVNAAGRSMLEKVAALHNEQQQRRG